MKFLLILTVTLSIGTTALAAGNPCSNIQKPSREILLGMKIPSAIMAGGGGGSGGSDAPTDNDKKLYSPDMINPCLLVSGERFQDLIMEAGYYNRIEIDGKILTPSIIDLKNKSIIAEDDENFGEEITIGVK